MHSYAAQMDAIVAVGAMAMSSELRRPNWAMRSLRSRPLGLGRLHAPQVELERSLGRSGVGVRLVGTVGLGELVGGRESPVVDLFLDARGKLRRPWVVEGEPQLEEDILQAHDSQTNGPPLAVRVSGRVGGVEVDVDYAVEVPHRCPDDLPEALQVEAILAGRSGRG